MKQAVVVPSIMASYPHFGSSHGAGWCMFLAPGRGVALGTSRHLSAYCSSHGWSPEPSISALFSADSFVTLEFDHVGATDIAATGVPRPRCSSGKYDSYLMV